MLEEDSEVEELDSSQHFQVNVVVLEAKHLAMFSADSKIIVTIGSRKKILRSKTGNTDAPYFNELCIFNFYQPLSNLLDEILTIKLYRVPKIRRSRLLGSFNVELSTIWRQPNHQFYHKWATLTDPKNPAGGVKGYLKCDMAILGQGAKTGPQDDDQGENIEDHLLVPFGEVNDRQRAKFVFSLFRADNFSNSVSNQPVKSIYPYVRITYGGITGKTTVVGNTLEPLWNEELAFIDMIPALCQHVHIEVCDAMKATSKGTIGIASLDLRKLSHESESGFLPTYGPSFLYIYQNFAEFERHSKCCFVNSSFTYMCRLLLALRTEVVDYAEDVLVKKEDAMVVKPKSIPSLKEGRYFQYKEFILFAVVFDILLFDASVIDKHVSVRVNIGPEKPINDEKFLRQPMDTKSALKRRISSEIQNGDDAESGKSRKTVTFSSSQASELDPHEGDTLSRHSSETLDGVKEIDYENTKEIRDKESPVEITSQNPEHEKQEKKSLSGFLKYNYRRWRTRKTPESSTAPLRKTDSVNEENDSAHLNIFRSFGRIRNIKRNTYENNPDTTASKRTHFRKPGEWIPVKAIRNWSSEWRRKSGLKKKITSESENSSKESLPLFSNEEKETNLSQYTTETSRTSSSSKLGEVNQPPLKKVTTDEKSSTGKRYRPVKNFKIWQGEHKIRKQNSVPEDFTPQTKKKLEQKKRKFFLTRTLNTGSQLENWAPWEQPISFSGGWVRRKQKKSKEGSGTELRSEKRRERISRKIKKRMLSSGEWKTPKDLTQRLIESRTTKSRTSTTSTENEEKPEEKRFKQRRTKIISNKSTPSDVNSSKPPSKFKKNVSKSRQNPKFLNANTEDKNEKIILTPKEMKPIATHDRWPFKRRIREKKNPSHKKVKITLKQSKTQLQGETNMEKARKKKKVNLTFAEGTKSDPDTTARTAHSRKTGEIFRVSQPERREGTNDEASSTESLFLCNCEGKMGSNPSLLSTKTIWPRKTGKYDEAYSDESITGIRKKRKEKNDYVQTDNAEDETDSEEQEVSVRPSYKRRYFPKKTRHSQKIDIYKTRKTSLDESDTTESDSEFTTGSQPRDPKAISPQTSTNTTGSVVSEESHENQQEHDWIKSDNSLYTEPSNDTSSEWTSADPRTKDKKEHKKEAKSKKSEKMTEVAETKKKNWHRRGDMKSNTQTFSPDNSTEANVKIYFAKKKKKKELFHPESVTTSEGSYSERDRKTKEESEGTLITGTKGNTTIKRKRHAMSITKKHKMQEENTSEENMENGVKRKQRKGKKFVTKEHKWIREKTPDTTITKTEENETSKKPLKKNKLQIFDEKKRKMQKQISSQEEVEERSKRNRKHENQKTEKKHKSVPETKKESTQKRHIKKSRSAPKIKATENVNPSKTKKKFTLSLRKRFQASETRSPIEAPHAKATERGIKAKPKKVSRRNQTISIKREHNKEKRTKQKTGSNHENLIRKKPFASVRDSTETKRESFERQKNEGLKIKQPKLGSHKQKSEENKKKPKQKKKLKFVKRHETKVKDELSRPKIELMFNKKKLTEEKKKKQRNKAIKNVEYTDRSQLKRKRQRKYIRASTLLKHDKREEEEIISRKRSHSSLLELKQGSGEDVGYKEPKEVIWLNNNEAEKKVRTFSSGSYDSIHDAELDEDTEFEEKESKREKKHKHGKKEQFRGRKRRRQKPTAVESEKDSEIVLQERDEIRHIRIYNGCNSTKPNPITVRANYGYTSFSGKYPCVHVNGEWPNALRRMYRSNIIQKSLTNLTTGIKEVENEITSENKMEASEKLKKVYASLSTECQHILALTEKIVPQDTNLYRERKKVYHREMKNIIAAAETASKKRLLLAEDELKRTRTYLLTLKRYAQDPEHSFPDTEIWLMKNGKNVAQHRIRTQKIVFSPNDNERGISTGKVHSVLVRGKQGEIVAKLEMFMWFGLAEDFVECRKMLPSGFEQEVHACPGTNISDVPLHLTYREVHHFQCRVHLFQARILVPADDNGLADPFVRATVLGQQKETQIQKETLNPTWDEMLFFTKLTIHGPADYIKANSLTMTIEVYDYDYLSKNELLGRTLIKPKVFLRGEKYQPPKLTWEDIRRDCLEVGKILITSEFLEVSREEPKDQKTGILPIPREIRPNSVGHRMEVLFWGVRELKKKSMRVLVTLECGGKAITSPLLKNATKNLNFSGKVQTIDLQLPEEPEYKPPLILKLFQTTQFAMGPEIYTGNCIVPSVGSFFCMTVDNEERKKQEIAFKTLLEESKRLKKEEEQEALAVEAAKKRKQRWKRLKAKIADIFESITAVFVKLYKTVKCKIQRSCTTVETDFMTDYDETETLDWWVKYYASKDHKNERQDAESLIIYDGELEAQPEFRGLSDFIYTFNILTGKMKKNVGTPIVVGKVKAAIKLYRWPLVGNYHTLNGVDIQKGVLRQLPSNDAIKYVARVYIIACKNLTPKDIYGKSDPYLILQVGKQKIDDKKNYISKQLNPIFGRCYEFHGHFPKEHLLNIKVVDHDVFSEDDLIGETTIDLESRYYTKHHASCGLSQTYTRQGYAAWRDVFKPTEILKSVCKQSNMPEPVYTEHGVRIGEYEFQGQTKNEKHKMEIHALAALKKWHEIPLRGFHLVPEHIETRALYHPSFPGVEQGKLEMWVDIFPADFRYVPPIVDIEPRKPVAMELRAIIWNVEDVILNDTTIFYNEKMSDIYVQGWLNALEGDKQVTDVHYRSMNGEGNFNWRFVFPFNYISTERRLVVYRKETVFDIDAEEMKFPCRLELQVWDNDFFSDDFLGSLNLELCSMPRGAKISTRCKLSMFEESTPKINLFKIRRTRGWWPFRRIVDAESSEYGLAGKIDLELEVLTESEAKENPVGRGREEPKALPQPKRPETSFIWFLNPLKTFRFIICRKYGKHLIILLLVAMGVVFVLLAIYALPGYAVKKMIGA